MTANPIPKGKIFSLSLAHMFNDWYMNFLQTLLPFIVALGTGIGRAALLISAFTATASILQPVLGYFVDRKNQRWLVHAGTVWMAVLLSLVGTTHNYHLLLLLSTLSGLGTAAFHPQAAAMISSVSGSRKGLCQSIFVAGGNVGWALTPLMVIPVVKNYGLSATPVFAVPGILVALLLWFTAPETSAAPTRKSSAPLLTILRASWLELTKIVLIVACRSLTYFGLISFLPLYLQMRNVSIVASSHLLFIMLFSGAIGGVLGGYLSDQMGRKSVIAGSLILSTPCFHLFLQGSGFTMYLYLILAGAFLLASFSVTIVLAQEIISENAATASGLTLGFGIGIGGLGVGLVGILIEHMGLAYGIGLLLWLPLAAGLFALTLTKKNVVAALEPTGKEMQI
jgi:FSR family fosmidomycin resistance protein-like MFS transporter